MKTRHQPIVIVRKRKSSTSAHHGGSWKIAYADFMTVMMAFFMVMWLLSTVSPEQRLGIADYFKNPLKLAMGTGNKSSFSDSVIPGGGDDFIKQEGEVLKKKLEDIDRIKSRHHLQRAFEKLQSLIHTDPQLSHFASNLRLSLTEDGLLIQVTDTQDRPMFKVGSKDVEPYMNNILLAMIPVLSELPNKISLTGHTDSLPYSGGDKGYSNWELSADRANASRRILVGGGLSGNKFLRVIGTANMINLKNMRCDDPANRRISILVLSEKKEKSIMVEDTVQQGISVNPTSEKLISGLNGLSTPDVVISTEQHGNKEVTENGR